MSNRVRSSSRSVALRCYRFAARPAQRWRPRQRRQLAVAGERRRHRRSRRQRRDRRHRPARRYGVKSTTTATKTNTDIKDIPQALTVISENQIEDQQLRSIADVLTFVPGATPGTGEANRDQFTLRGNNTTADFFVDGIRDDVQYFRDLYNVDRVEVLKGPNAMIFGRGGGGGIVNRVTKRSSLGTYRESCCPATAKAASRSTGDVDQPLGDGVGLRVNGMYENGDSFRRHVDLERYGINPTVGIHRRRRYADRPRLRIFPRPPHHRPRRAVASATSRSEGLRPRPSSAIRTTAMPRPTSTSPRFGVEHRARRRPDAAQPHALRRLRQILPEHLPDRRSTDGDRRACRARRLQQPQRPQESVQPDRPHLGKPARRHRPDARCSASNSAARSRATCARAAPSPGCRQPTCRSPIPPSMSTSTFASRASDANNRTRGDRRRRLCPGPDPHLADVSRSSPACASTASSSTSTTSAVDGSRFQPHRRAVVAAPRPDLQAAATICRSMPATAAPICRSRATSSAA